MGTLWGMQTLKSAVPHETIYSVQNSFPNIINQSSPNLKSPLACCLHSIVVLPSGLHIRNYQHFNG